MYNATKFKDSRFYPYKLITAFLHISNIKYIKITCLKSSNCIHLTTIFLRLKYPAGLPQVPSDPNYFTNTTELYFEGHVVCSMFHVSMYKRKHTEGKSVLHITTVLKSGDL